MPVRRPWYASCVNWRSCTTTKLDRQGRVVSRCVRCGGMKSGWRKSKQGEREENEKLTKEEKRKRREIREEKERW